MSTSWYHKGHEINPPPKCNINRSRTSHGTFRCSGRLRREPDFDWVHKGVDWRVSVCDSCERVVYNVPATHEEGGGDGTTVFGTLVGDDARWSDDERQLAYVPDGED